MKTNKNKWYEAGARSARAVKKRFATKKKVTVRKLQTRDSKKILFGVGLLEDGVWSILRDSNPPIQLLYTTRKKAEATAKYLRENWLNK